jgi:hypothetical protein
MISVFLKVNLDIIHKANGNPKAKLKLGIESISQLVFIALTSY